MSPLPPAPELKKTRWGFYQYAPLPSDAELQAYYAEKYYQEGRGSYQVTYSEEDRAWFRLRHTLTFTKVTTLLERAPLRLLDVGCGEGWLMDVFQEAGHTVRGLDFSQAGIQHMHPHLLDRLVVGNVYQSLAAELRGGARYDVVSCCNVVEHVKEPVALLREIRGLLSPDGLLVIVVPNDFSPLHEYLLQEHFIDTPWWLCYPDHLSYFNKASMTALLEDLGYRLRAVMADHPIDLNLLNDTANYARDRAKGPAIHRFRVRTDLFLARQDRRGLMDLYARLGEMGVGRNLIYFATPA